MDDTMNDSTACRLLDLIHAEYREMPGLALTKPQIQRFWSIDSVACSAAVDALVSAQVLKRTVRDSYVLAGTSA
jgi:hypothetical protein